MRIIRYFPDTDLRNGHDGLTGLAKKNGINVNRLDVGEFVVFVNKSKTSIKMFAPPNVIAYYKSTNGKINPAVIQHLPNCFDGGSIDYDKAILKVVKKEFPQYEW